MFQFEDLEVENLDVKILPVTPFKFMSINDIAVRPTKCHVIPSDEHTALGTPNSFPTIVLRAPPTPTTLWPGNFIEPDVPSDVLADSAVADPRGGGAGGPVPPPFGISFFFLQKQQVFYLFNYKLLKIKFQNVSLKGLKRFSGSICISQAVPDNY